MSYKLLFKYTSRSRPDLFFRGLLSILNHINDKENYHILCSFDEDDATMNNKSVTDRLDQIQNLSYFFGTSTSKINAINRDFEMFPVFDILINFSDDQVFITQGFDDMIRADMSLAADDLDMFLHYPDQNVGDRLPTMSIMGEEYFRRFGYIYHPDYNSVYADNEAMDVAKILGKYKFISSVIFDHLHPVFGGAAWDEQYRKTEDAVNYKKDREVYYARKKRKFDL
jgi:hypothetical protein